VAYEKERQKTIKKQEKLVDKLSRLAIIFFATVAVISLWIVGR